MLLLSKDIVYLKEKLSIRSETWALLALRYIEKLEDENLEWKLRSLQKAVSQPTHRRTDPETSRQAHRKVGASKRRLQVMRNLKERPRTDFEHGFQQTSAGKRRLELERAGFVEWTGETAETGSGSLARVYQLTPQGLEALADFEAEELEAAWS